MTKVETWRESFTSLCTFHTIYVNHIFHHIMKIHNIILQQYCHYSVIIFSTFVHNTINFHNLVIIYINYMGSKYGGKFFILSPYMANMVSWHFDPRHFAPRHFAPSENHNISPSYACGLVSICFRNIKFRFCFCCESYIMQYLLGVFVNNCEILVAMINW